MSYTERAKKYSEALNLSDKEEIENAIEDFTSGAKSERKFLKDKVLDLKKQTKDKSKLSAYISVLKLLESA